MLRVGRNDTLPALRGGAGNDSTPRILVADDDDAVRRAIERVLTREGFAVVQAKDGAQAGEALTADSFDVVLTDIHMPGASGVDLLRLIRAYDLDVPVVLMTGAPEVSTAMEAVELGALRYLAKPVSPELLVSVVKRACRMRVLAKLKRDSLAALGRDKNEAGDLAGLQAKFDRALEGLWVAFQPIVGVVERRVVAYEALMRSNEPALPHPGAVLDAAERLGRVQDVGRRMRELTARAAAGAPNGVLLFVNLHPTDLLDPELASDSVPLAKLASRTVLEITERSTLDDIKGLEARLSILRFMGFRAAVDDMGAGYAGLTSFARLEPEFVKLDMGLVREIDSSPIRQRIVQAMVSLCQDMTMRVIAEGIETARERETLLDLGCDWMQGYWFARPQRGFVAPDKF